MKPKLLIPAMGAALAAMFDHTGNYKALGIGPKRKPRKCLNSDCNKKTDHKGGYCSSQCAKADR